MKTVRNVLISQGIANPTDEQVIAALGGPLNPDLIPGPEKFVRSELIRQITQTTSAAELTRRVLGHFGIIGPGVSGYLETQYHHYQNDESGWSPAQLSARAHDALPGDAAISLAFGNLDEAVDEFRGTLFRDVITRAKNFGEFVVVQAGEAGSQSDLRSAV